MTAAAPDEQSPKPLTTPLWHHLLLLALTCAALWPVTTADFVRWDDPHNLPANPDMNPPTAPSIARYWDPRRPYKDLYIPFTYTVWGGLALLAGADAADGPPTLNPHVFHAANLLLHALSASIVLAILTRLLGATWPAWAGAALFAIHPVQVEPVAWASGMKDVLSGLLSLTAVLLYIRHAQAMKDQPRARWGNLTLATLAFALAMLSKPSAVIVPLIAGTIDLLLIRRPLRTIALTLAPWLLMSLVIAVIARRAQPASALDYIPPSWARPVVALDALAFYARQIVMPLNLCIDYGRSPHWLLQSPQRWFTWSIPAALAAVALARAKHSPVPLTALALLVAGLLPVLGLVPFDFQSYSTVTDHYLYLAMLAPALLAAWLLARRQGRITSAVALALLLALAIRSFIQTWTWRDSRTLFTHTISVNPASLVGNVNLANLLSERGLDLLRQRQFTDALADLESAARHYRAALNTRPSDVAAHVGLGNTLVLLGRPAQAAAAYAEGLKHQPDSPDLHAGLGRALLTQGNDDEALPHLREALRLDPQHRTAFIDLANLMKRRATTTPPP